MKVDQPVIAFQLTVCSSATSKKTHYPHLIERKKKTEGRQHRTVVKYKKSVEWESECVNQKARKV